MTKWKIYNEDAVEWAKNYQKGKFHALLCDAPYHLTSIVKRFGKAKMSDNTKTSEKVRNRSDGYSRLINTGFMGATWDGGDLAFRPETWQAFGEVLYPGAFGMAFSASRNWHRMAVAIEDAGFVLHPTIFLWTYGQGFPKATNISKQLDYHDGSQTWEGHRYGLQALKPAVEPIIVFQKPYEGKPIQNIVSTGAGALNIDGARIPTQDEYVINTFDDGAKPFGNGAGHKYTSRIIKTGSGKGKIGNDYGWSNTERDGKDWEGSEKGRWPSNLILTEESAENLDAQSGYSVSNIRPPTPDKENDDRGTWQMSRRIEAKPRGVSDSGGASRFFYQVSTQLDESDPVYYCGKVSPKERNAGLDELEDKTMAVSGGAQGASDRGEDEYLQDSIGLNRIKIVKNNHPTLKPIDLCKYLATLLLPPIEYAPRRIFVPFSGSGSEMIAAGLAGWEHVVGVEFDTENGYVDIAEKRLQHWLTAQVKSS